jgi:hypothetical protein
MKQINKAILYHFHTCSAAVTLAVIILLTDDLFNNTVSGSDYTALLVNNEFERMWNKVVIA